MNQKMQGITGFSLRALAARSPMFWVMFILAVICFILAFACAMMGLKQIESKLNTGMNKGAEQAVKKMIILAVVCFIMSTIFMLLGFFVFK